MYIANNILRIAAALTVVAALAAPALAKEKARQPKAKSAEFDFKKTNAFIREMEGRPDFPVATVIANDYVYTLLAMGEKIDTGRQNAIILAAKLAQQKDGGFTPDKSSKTSSILYTDIALETLALLDAGNAIDRNKVKAFAASLKNHDGGFGFSTDARKSSLATTYYALHVLKAVNGLDAVDRGKTLEYVKGFAKKEGGFGPEKGPGRPNARSTYMAAYILNALSGMDAPTAKSALQYLESTPYLDKKSKERPDLDEQLYTIRALKEINAGNRVDKALAFNFMKRLYIKVNGGFGPLEGYGSTPDSTTTALRILSEIGKVKGVQVQVAKR
ncbi:MULTISPECIES: prenyltransferase/squalene oxidase repeat-containing protein [Geomonas]|uniref:Geranylgeranyl transferase type II subunit beta n=1 Tax=Geomonas anaerohicana TaxID=2798583 RepID=A0ABS0YHG8_9BACT|nr:MULTISPECIES: prenyltransferase/squalene oxidase repeat-containing protein [Geomonas]MBJ6751716.1 terpene cyclase/mutase family protein [Geomonas anaerohicana]MBU5611513.1 terpene cyclase/mutase family protein [Geomonas azotofigens]